jgi:hypothetical protein
MSDPNDGEPGNVGDNRPPANITVEEFYGLQKRAAEGSIGLAQMKEIAAGMPQFAELQKQTLNGLKEIVDGAAKTQTVGLETVGKAVENASRTLDTLGQSAESDETREKLAELQVEIGRIGLDTTKAIVLDNNQVYKMMVGVALSGLAAAALWVFSGGMAGRPKA